MKGWVGEGGRGGGGEGTQPSAHPAVKFHLHRKPALPRLWLPQRHPVILCDSPQCPGTASSLQIMTCLGWGGGIVSANQRMRSVRWHVQYGRRDVASWREVGRGSGGRNSLTRDPERWRFESRSARIVVADANLCNAFP